jgi:hypothetical protein
VVDGDLRVYVLRAFDTKLAAKLAARAGLDVRLVSYPTFANKSPDALTQLHSAALSDGQSSAARIGTLDLFASSFPVFASTGEAIALIETRLPAVELDATVNALVHRLWVTALVLGALAVFAAVWLGKQVADPVSRRFLYVDSRRWRSRSWRAIAHDGRHATQSGGSHGHAASA